MGGYWLLVEVPGEGPTLRLSHDEHGERLFPTPVEAERLEREAERLEREAERFEREAETRRADEAERELRELKALLQIEP